METDGSLVVPLQLNLNQVTLFSLWDKAESIRVLRFFFFFKSIHSLSGDVYIKSTIGTAVILALISSDFMHLILKCYRSLNVINMQDVTC